MVIWVLDVDKYIQTFLHLREKKMYGPDFYVEFNVEVPNVGDEFKVEADERLRRLAWGHSDIIGASVAVEPIVQVETPFRYQVRIVAYARPEYLTVIEKDSDPHVALRNALNALERLVLETREKLEQRERPNVEQTFTHLYDMSAKEIYDAYVDDAGPFELVDQDRDKIASRLIVSEGLNHEAAYHAADQILKIAHEILGGTRQG